MKKTLFFAIAIVFSQSASGKPSGGSAASCMRAVQAADRKDICIPNSGGSGSLPTAAGGLNGLSTISTSITGLGSTESKAYISACQKPQQKCDQECSGQTGPAKDRCDWFKSQLDEAQKQVDQDNKDKEASKKSGEQSGGGGMPQMPKGDENKDQQQQQPQAVATPASTTDCATNPAGADCTKTQKDAANDPPAPSSFASGGGSSGSTSSTNGSSFSSEPAAQQASSAGGVTPPPGGSGGGGGMGSASSANPNKELPPGVYDQAAKNITDVLNGERGGGGAGGGGGGFSGYGTSMDGSNLAAYLPGRKLDPNKAKAAGDRKPASMEVASVHADIFSMITKRFQILCKLKEIRDCD